MALTKNHVFEALDAFKITWLQNKMRQWECALPALDAFKITWLQNEEVLDAREIALLWMPLKLHGYKTGNMIKLSVTSLWIPLKLHGYKTKEKCLCVRSGLWIPLTLHCFKVYNSHI